MSLTRNVDHASTEGGGSWPGAARDGLLRASRPLTSSGEFAVNEFRQRGIYKRSFSLLREALDAPLSERHPCSLLYGTSSMLSLIRNVIHALSYSVIIP